MVLANPILHYDDTTISVQSLSPVKRNLNHYRREQLHSLDTTTRSLTVLPIWHSVATLIFFSKLDPFDTTTHPFLSPLSHASHGRFPFD
jgi:hypothetical protein